MHTHHDRHFKTDVDYGPGWRQARRDNINDDVAPDDVSLIGPPTRSSRERSREELAAYGYAGQGYPIYGQPGGSTAYDDLEPGWFADPSSAAYAFGYTTSLRSNDPFPSEGHYSAQAPASSRAGVSSRGHAGKGPKEYPRADARVLEDVCDRLSDDDEVDASAITVTIENGEVTLSGDVVDRYSKRRAEHIAASVRGVIDVHNQLSARKGMMRDLRDELAGNAADQHHGHRGEGPLAR
ncbi:MAG TPA: BON domain-containing protein [Polyangiaceae bacterium]|nr:BON domain-containing protein [Polyangiaceae bacterium]